MKIFLLSFLGSFFGIITAFIALNFFKKFRNLIFSDKALDDKVFKNHKCHKFKRKEWKNENIFFYHI